MPSHDASHVPRGAELLVALQRAVFLARDPEPLERTMLAYLVHPDGGAFERAWLLVWNAPRGTLDGWLDVERESEASLAEALDPTRLRRADPELQERTALLRRRHVTPGDLGETEARAWSGTEAVSGVAARTTVPWNGGGRISAVAVRAGVTPYGLIVVAGGGGPRAEEVLASVSRLAGDSVQSWERVAGLERRAAEVEALAQAARSGVVAMNVAEALHLAARLAVRTTQARGCAVWRMVSGALRLDVTRGPAGGRERLARALAPLAAEVAATGAARILDEAREDPRIESADADALGAVALIPLMAFGRCHGVLAAFDRAALHPAEGTFFEAGDRVFLTALCEHLALLLDQAARFDALRATERQRDAMRGWIRREEWLAAMGENAARVAREARNPLASIAAFARRAHRELEGDDPRRDHLEIVMREAERLERIMQEQSAWASAEPPRLAMESVNDVVQRVLQVSGEKLVRRRIRLMKRLGPDVPGLLLDPDRVGRVVANIIAHAIDAAAVGGRVRVMTRIAAGFTVLEVAHDGPRPADGLLEHLFAPFAGGGEAEPTLGLGLARQVVQAHGGEIRVRADAEWTAIVTLTLPIRENGDRRTGGVDRRMPRRDRRERYPRAPAH